MSGGERESRCGAQAGRHAGRNVTAQAHITSRTDRQAGRNIPGQSHATSHSGGTNTVSSKQWRCNVTGIPEVLLYSRKGSETSSRVWIVARGPACIFLPHRLLGLLLSPPPRQAIRPGDSFCLLPSGRTMSYSRQRLSPRPHLDTLSCRHPSSRLRSWKACNNNEPSPPEGTYLTQLPSSSALSPRLTPGKADSVPCPETCTRPPQDGWPFDNANLMNFLSQLPSCCYAIGEALVCKGLIFSPVVD